MRGLMMDFPLTVPALLERAGHIFGKVEIVTRRPDRSHTRITWRDLYGRARRLANALTSLGLQRGDRVATLLWNQSEHMEAYFGVPFGGCATPAGCLGYEELLSHASDDFTYPQLDENEAAVMCYTSGTTGRSKGVVYSHRAVALHSLDCCGTDSFAISFRDTVLPMASMFHANGWGIPFTTAMAGSKVVLPGPFADPEGILDLMEQERVTVVLGVPTVWFGVLNALDNNPGRWKFSWPIRMLVGGSAASEALMRGFDRHGFKMMSLWGMTETTPHGACSQLRPHMDEWSEADQYAQRL